MNDPLCYLGVAIGVIALACGLLALFHPWDAPTKAQRGLALDESAEALVRMGGQRGQVISPTVKLPPVADKPTPPEETEVPRVLPITLRGNPDDAFVRQVIDQLCPEVREARLPRVIVVAPGKMDEFNRLHAKRGWPHPNDYNGILIIPGEIAGASNIEGAEFWPWPEPTSENQATYQQLLDIQLSGWNQRILTTLENS